MVRNTSTLNTVGAQSNVTFSEALGKLTIRAMAKHIRTMAKVHQQSPAHTNRIVRSPSMVNLFVAPEKSCSRASSTAAVATLL